MAEDIVNCIRKLKEKLNENHHEIEDFFNKELKVYLSQSGNENHTSVECDNLIKALDEALEVVVAIVNFDRITLKDRLQQAQIDVLKRKVMYCKCQDEVVMLRKDSKKARERPKNLFDSGISITSSTDSRVMSDPGDAPVVQPTDASDDSIDKGENDTGKTQLE